jgi:hypothetical protein
MILLMAGGIAYSDTRIVFDKPRENANVDIMKAFKNRKSERSVYQSNYFNTSSFNCFMVRVWYKQAGWQTHSANSIW